MTWNDNHDEDDYDCSSWLWWTRMTVVVDGAAPRDDHANQIDSSFESSDDWLLLRH